MPMFLLHMPLRQLLRIPVFLAPVLPDSSPIFGWWTTTPPDVIHDSSSSKGYGATDLNEEATNKISTKYLQSLNLEDMV
jgi:hypothetical protein